MSRVEAGEMRHTLQLLAPCRPMPSHSTQAHISLLAFEKPGDGAAGNVVAGDEAKQISAPQAAPRGPNAAAWHAKLASIAERELRQPSAARRAPVASRPYGRSVVRLSAGRNVSVRVVCGFSGGYPMVRS